MTPCVPAQVTSGSCLGCSVFGSPFAATPFVSAPLILAGLPQPVSTPLNLTSPLTAAMLNSVSTGMQRIAESCSRCDVQAIAHGRRLQGNCWGSALKATVVCGLAVTAGTAFAIATGPVAGPLLAPFGFAAGTYLAREACGRTWGKASMAIGSTIDGVRAQVATALSGGSRLLADMPHGDAEHRGRWLQSSASSPLLYNMSSPLPGSNNTVIFQVVLIPHDDLAELFLNTTLVQAVWNAAAGPVLRNATLFNETFPGLNASLAQFTGNNVRLSQMSALVAGAGFLPMDGYNNTNATLSATSFPTPSTSPSQRFTAASSPTPSASASAPAATAAVATTGTSPTPTESFGFRFGAATSPSATPSTGTKPTEQPGLSSTALIAIGASVGGAAAVGLAILTYCCCGWYCARKTPEQDLPDLTDHDDVNAVKPDGHSGVMPVMAATIVPVTPTPPVPNTHRYGTAV
jgi:hypothetical protein